MNRYYDENNEEIKPVKPNRSLFAGGLALILIASAFFSGLQIGSGSVVNAEAGVFSFFRSHSTAVDTNVDMSEFWRVWNLLEEKFSAPTSTHSVSVEDRMHGAIKGLVNSYGDPYTVFMPPTEAAAFQEDISGNFSGVGMEVGMRNGLITVIAPLPETPAEQAGLLPGDVIVKIDDVSTDSMSIDSAVKMIRGEKGTEVTLTVAREGASGFIEKTLIRDTISIPTIKTEIKGDVFVITLYNFNALAEMKMQEALREYVRSGVDKMVLDLRGNPGGFLQSAVAIGSYFLPTGKVILREKFGGDREEVLYRSQGRTLHGFAPKEMVVLVDGGSASAAEILAGALSEHGVATLMGARTFGKGSVQELVRLPNRSSLKVTIARWLTPMGQSISDGGLEPQVLVERSFEDREAGIDPQLDAALKWLAGERDFLEESETDASHESE